MKVGRVTGNKTFSFFGLSNHCSKINMNTLNQKMKEEFQARRKTFRIFDLDH